MTDSESDRNHKLEELLDRWEAAREKEHNLTVEELCRDAPELAEALKQQIGALFSFGSLPS